MNVKRLKELVEENRIVDPQNDVIQNQIIKEMEAILSLDLEETLNYLDNASDNEIEYISQTYEQLSCVFNSSELINCMQRNAIRTGVDCDVDIKYAIKALKDSKK